MKINRSRSARSVVLDGYKPLRHSFGVIHNNSIVHDVEWHQHSEYELLYMEIAYGTFLVGDHLFSFNDHKKTDLLLFFGKHLPHSFHYRNQIKSLPDKVNVYSLVFTDDCLGQSFFHLPELNRIRSFLESSARGYIIDHDPKKEITSALKALHGKEGIERLQLFLEILKRLEANKHLTPISESPTSAENSGFSQDRIHKILKFLYSNYNRDLKVSEVADIARMSPQSFRLYFKKTTGQNFLRFLNQLRISKVCEDLLVNEDDITTIAFRNGFNNLSNFNRRFKQIKKMTPKAYKELSRN